MMPKSGILEGSTLLTHRFPVRSVRTVRYVAETLEFPAKTAELLAAQHLRAVAPVFARRLVFGN